MNYMKPGLLYSIANHCGVTGFQLACEMVQQAKTEEVLDVHGNKVHFTPDWVVLISAQ